MHDRNHTQAHIMTIRSGHIGKATHTCSSRNQPTLKKHGDSQRGDTHTHSEKRKQESYNFGKTAYSSGYGAEYHACTSLPPKTTHGLPSTVGSAAPAPLSSSSRHLLAASRALCLASSYLQERHDQRSAVHPFFCPSSTEILTTLHPRPLARPCVA